MLMEFIDLFETDYDVNVGMEVSKAENSELVTTIPAGKYAKFSIHGHIVHDVSKAWDESGI